MPLPPSTRRFYNGFCLDMVSSLMEAMLASIVAATAVTTVVLTIVVLTPKPMNCTSDIIALVDTSLILHPFPPLLVLLAVVTLGHL